MPSVRAIPPRRIRGFSVGRSLIALLLMAHLLAVVVLAALPHLHEHLHVDAGLEDHECAVTLFQHGGYSGAAPEVITVAQITWAPYVHLAPASVWVKSTFLTGCVLERAPPCRAALAPHT